MIRAGNVGKSADFTDLAGGSGPFCLSEWQIDKIGKAQAFDIAGLAHKNGPDPKISTGAYEIAWRYE